MNRFNIGRRIEAYRDRVKMSTQELAGRIKRSQATISRIENGKQGMTFELLACIACELRVHPFALLSDDPPQASAPVAVPVQDRPGEDGDAPGAAQSLAALQATLSHIRRIIHSGGEGEEASILARILTLLDTADAGVPDESESSSGEAGLFPNRLPLRMVDAEEGVDFRRKMFRMSGTKTGDPLEHNRLQ